MRLDWVRTEGDATQAVLYGPLSFAEMTQDEHVRACYFHAVLKFLSGEKMKNASLCERLGIERQNAAQATTIINRTREAGLIRVAAPAHPRASYVPTGREFLDRVLILMVVFGGQK